MLLLYFSLPKRTKTQLFHFFLNQALRNQQKSKTLSEADRIHKNLLSALVKHSAISKVLSEKAKAALTASTSPPKKSKDDDDELYVLPPSQSFDSTTQSEDSSDEDDSGLHKYDLHSIDTESVEFKSLPVDVRHEILTDLKETRKQSSWGRIHELPTESDDFSIYQMRRLLKRQSVQNALEEVEKEMGGHSLSLGELEKILKDQGVITNLKGNRIASDENTRFLLIKDIKQAMEEAKKQQLPAIEETNEETVDEEKKMPNKGDQEFEDDLKKAIAMSLEEVPSTSKSEPQMQKKIGGKGKKRLSLSFLDDADFDESESSEEEQIIQTRLTAAQSYMMEYSGLTPSEIAKILASKSKVKKIEEKKVEEATKSEVKKIVEKPVEIVESSSNVTKVSIDDNVVTTSEDIVTTSTPEEEIQVMSDSESSNDGDFVDVDLEEDKKAMEVVIKPDEEIEDDLFKDVFEEVEKSEVTSTQEKNIEEIKVTSTQEKVIEGIKQFVSTSIEESPTKSESVLVSEESFEEVRDEKSEEKKEETSTGQRVKEKIEKLVKEYSRPREEENGTKDTELTVEQLNEMRENLRKEQQELVVEKQTKERTAGNITEQMYQEAQVRSS